LAGARRIPVRQGAAVRRLLHRQTPFVEITPDKSKH
jgi:hypothetical protein